MKGKRVRRVLPAAATLFMLFLAGCGSATPQTRATGQYQAPPMALSAYHADAAQTIGAASIDISAVQQGYVAVSATSEKRLKFQVVFGDTKYNYDLPGDGTPVSYVLQSGSGEYVFRVMENVVEDKYVETASLTQTVTLTDEFQPFLRPSQMVAYDADSACVKKAAELAAGAADDAAVTAAVYDYIKNNIAYDTEKAQTVQNGYLPLPDDTLMQGKGICYDYAALAAAMLRSQGIPTKMITGYVSPEGIYHAWNLVWLEASGWIAVEIQAPSEQWERIDLTFAAGGAQTQIGDGTQYTVRFTY